MPKKSTVDLIPVFIRRNGLRPGDRMPAERDLAEQLGVSQSAVNRAVFFLVGKGLLRRQGYKLYVAADARPPIELWAFIPEKIPLRAARQMAEALGCRLNTPKSREENHIRLALLDLDPGAVDGVLMWWNRCSDQLDALAERGVPVVIGGETSARHHSVFPDAGGFGRSAVEHLSTLGHEEIAFVEIENEGDYAGLRPGMRAGYGDACRDRGFTASAARIYSSVSDALADVAQTWDRLHRENPAVTGLVCRSTQMARHLIDLAKMSGFNVPDDLSIVSLSEDLAAAVCEPPLTTVYEHSATMAKIAVLLLHDLARQPRQRMTARQHSTIRKTIMIAPCVTVRESTAALLGHAPMSEAAVQAPRSTRPNWPQVDKWASKAKERSAQAAALNARPFPSSRGSLADFIPLDLSRAANRSCAREHGWLGDEPLHNLPTGEVYYHGVPFQLLDEQENEGRAAVILRSRRAHTGGGNSLPTSVTIPIRRMARAVYILHAAGWISEHRAFAMYDFLYQDGGSQQIQVVPFGKAAHDDAQQWREDAIVQDWHPSHERFESSRALPCVVTEDGDPLLYERYLYAWQWINPHPERRLRALRIRTLDPEARPTLAVLAVTLQKAAGKV